MKDFILSKNKRNVVDWVDWSTKTLWAEWVSLWTKWISPLRYAIGPLRYASVYGVLSNTLSVQTGKPLSKPFASSSTPCMRPLMPWTSWNHTSTIRASILLMNTLMGSKSWLRRLSTLMGSPLWWNFTKALTHHPELHWTDDRWLAKGWGCACIVQCSENSCTHTGSKWSLPIPKVSIQCTNPIHSCSEGWWITDQAPYATPCRACNHHHTPSPCNLFGSCSYGCQYS